MRTFEAFIIHHHIRHNTLLDIERYYKKKHHTHTHTHTH